MSSLMKILRLLRQLNIKEIIQIISHPPPSLSPLHSTHKADKPFSK